MAFLGNRMCKKSMSLSQSKEDKQPLGFLSVKLLPQTLSDIPQAQA